MECRMKRQILVVILVLTVCWGCGKSGDISGKSVGKIKLDTEERKYSYAAGYDMGQNFKTAIAETDLDYFTRGLRDAVNDVPLAIGKEDNEEYIQKFRNDVASKQRVKNQQAADKNKLEGEAFLKENAGKEGIKVTDSGLQYQVVKEGQGPKPTISDMVKIHYFGVFTNGEEFDNSYKRAAPMFVDLRRCIEGWKEGIQLMSKGARYRFFLPSALAYGRGGLSDQIGPNAVLIYEIELLDIKPIRKTEQ